MEMPSYLLLGHVTQDIVDSNVQFGGTACYAARTASNIGERVGLVTSAADDFPFGELLPAISVIRIPASTTTVFANTYSVGERRQFVRAIASKIHPSNVPKRWRRAPIVHLAPVAQEIDHRVARLFPRSLVGLTAQGWLREWDSEGRVRRAEWQSASAVLPYVDVLVVSEDDIGSSLSTMRFFASKVAVAILTQGERGAEVFYQGQVRHSPAFPTRVVDPTGAGDVFATAFLVKFHQTGAPMLSARFASCVASFVVEDVGTRGIPTLEQVNRRLAGLA